ncbi:MAG: LysM domain-containing protein, partial [Myxococcota bacterium]
PQFHIVKPNDTLGKIAQQYGITLAQLIAANPQFDEQKVGGPMDRIRRGDSGWDPDFIKVDERINLPPEAKLPGAVKPPAETKEPEPIKPKTPATPPSEDSVVTTPAPKPQTGPEPSKMGPQPTPPSENPPPRTGTTDPTQRTEGPAASEEKKGGIWGMLKKLFANPLFQGALAILSAIPGIGQIVSGLGAIIALTMFINSIISAPDGPGDYNWLALGSALLFLGGTFIPGLGAFGGLLGMAQKPPDDEPSGKPAGQRQTVQGELTPQTAPNVDPSTFQPMPQVEFESLLAQARKTPKLDGNQEEFGEWMASIGRLVGERRRLAAVKAAGQELAANEVNRSAQLQQFFDRELSQLTVMRELQLAYGINTTNAADTPTPGMPYIVQEGSNFNTLSASFAEAAGDTVDAAQAAAALRAYNGIAPDANPVAGQWLMVPSLEQFQAYASSGTPVLAEVVRAEQLATLKQQLGQLALQLRAAESPMAQEAARLWGILQTMAPRPGRLESRHGSDAGAEQLGAASPPA